MSAPTYQFIRNCVLLVEAPTPSLSPTLDLSDLRIKFSVKKTTGQTPNIANIRVYNVAMSTMTAIQKQYVTVTLQAGYESQSGVIFSGDIRQTIIGRESGTDSFFDILASDGAAAYNYAFISTSLLAGTSAQDDVNACAAVMTPMGVSVGQNSKVPATQKRPRGKVLHGACKDHLRRTAQTTNVNWSIQDGKLTFIPFTGYLPGQAVVINQLNGMIGTPQQTFEGVNVKCLLNPNLNVGTRIQLNNSTVQRLAINLTTANTLPSIPSATNVSSNTAAAIPIPLTTDGIYYVAALDFAGDTRGTEWYASIVSYQVNPIFQQGVGVGI